jgi:hypothetical protein
MLSGVRKDKFDVENFDSGDFMIIANVFDKSLKKNWSLANVYGPAQLVEAPTHIRGAPTGADIQTINAIALLHP